MRILYVCNDLDYWHAHREGLARRMRARGAEVSVLCGVPPDTPRAQEADDGLIRFRLERQALDPRRDVAMALRILDTARRTNADVVHLITLKPILFGGAALRGRLPGLRRTVATFAGLGRVFAAVPPDRRQRIVMRGLRYALGDPRAIAAFENAADRDRLVTAGTVPARRAAVIRGAGFDPAQFPPCPLPPGPAPGAPLRCLFAGRLLRSKGVDAIVDAARRLAAASVNARIAIAGRSGDDADAVPEAELAALAAAGLIDFLGDVAQAEMAATLAAHHLLLMPTRYPEGSPRVLTEAASVGRPAIVSDHAGCTAFVRDGRDGIVLPTPDGRAIAAAIASLAAAPERLAAMAASAQQRALTAGFTIDAVAEAYARIYAGGSAVDDAP